jgi:hypothetical protein
VLDKLDQTTRSNRIDGVAGTWARDPLSLPLFSALCPFASLFVYAVRQQLVNREVFCLCISVFLAITGTSAGNESISGLPSKEYRSFVNSYWALLWLVPLSAVAFTANVLIDYNRKRLSVF